MLNFMPFTFKRLSIPDVILVEPQSFSDDRGFFFESFKESDFFSNGIDKNFVQDNFSHSVNCLLYTSPSPRDATLSRMPSSA